MIHFSSRTTNLNQPLQSSFGADSRFLKILGLFLFAVLASCSGHRGNDSQSEVRLAATTTESQADLDVKNLMHGFYGHLVKLKPFFVAPGEFEKKENHKEISGHLNSLEKEIKGAMKGKVFASPGQKISLESFQTHVSEMKNVFDSGNKAYAHWMLVSSTSLCMSCHTQLPQSKDSKFGMVSDYTGLSADKIFGEAEFNFISRRFDLALKGYMMLIDGYSKNQLAPELLDRSVRRVVSIYARVKRDPVGGSLQFERLYKNKNLPKFIQDNSKAWMGLFNIWKKEGKDEISKMTGKEVVAFANKHMKKGLWDKMIEAGDPRVVTNLRVSGVLYEYLFQHPTGPETPEILYLLARAEYALGSDFFFSLSDLYLKECIVTYPKSEIAKECYREYEESVVVSYSGSSGTHLPADVQKNLRRLKSMVYSK
jgi:hypothetical protein